MLYAGSLMYRRMLPGIYYVYTRNKIRMIGSIHKDVNSEYLMFEPFYSIPLSTENLVDIVLLLDTLNGGPIRTATEIRKEKDNKYEF